MLQPTKRFAVMVLALLGLSAAIEIRLVSAAPLTAFSYQGKLTDGGSPANNNYDMMFRLYDAPTVGTGNQHGPDQPRNGVGVASGTFSVTLDFGNQYSSGNSVYLEIGVRPAGSGNPYSVLPRQPLLASPYAVEAVNAQFLGNLPASQYVATDVLGNAGLGDTPSPLMRLHIVSNAGQSPPRAISIGSGGGFTAGWDFFHLNTGKGFVGSPDANAPLGAGEMILFGSTGVKTSLWAGGGRALTIDPTFLTIGIGVNPAPNQKLSISNGGTGIAAYAAAGSSYGFWGQATGSGIGVYGETETASGVSGYASSTGNGVSGSTSSGVGVFASGLSGDGVYATSDSGRGVYASSGSSYGVYGKSTSLSGVYGESGAPNSLSSAGVHGVGTATGGIGVHGEANANNSVGVFGTSTNSGGFGVFARNTSGGRALYADGHASQTAGYYGIAKAMVEFDPRPSSVGLHKCYNFFTNSTTKPCGLTITKPAIGIVRVDFGFNITSLFALVSVEFPDSLNPNKNSGANYRLFGSNAMEVFTFDSSNTADTVDKTFTLILF